jgi:hypothetical protein
MLIFWQLLSSIFSTRLLRAIGCNFEGEEVYYAVKMQPKDSNND